MSYLMHVLVLKLITPNSNYRFLKLASGINHVKFIVIFFDLCSLPGHMIVRGSSSLEKDPTRPW